ncbi:MAG TPA: hypothetical protein VE596_12620 [Gaiellaceae bacterium]|jgi:hypothetical protein|nr:hypothetical protein [Gaiellaceae bacterium]
MAGHLVALAAVAATAAAPSATTAKPALRLVRIDPLIVQGRDFRRGERVTVTARLPRATRSARVLANAEGAFRVRLGRVRAYDRCASVLSVEARGSRGSKASVRTHPLACAVRQP